MQSNLLTPPIIGRSGSDPSRATYSYCSRIQKVLVVLSAMAISAHLAGCDFASLGGCASTSITLYKCASSVVMYNVITILFQNALKSMAWQISLGTATSAAVLLFVYLPTSAFVLIVELQRYLALFWLLLQGLIIIDIAHEVHLYIIKRAELAYNFRGTHAAKPWYLLHMGLSFFLLLGVVGSSHLLYSQCGRCYENVMAIGVTLLSAAASIFFSLSERCNKGCLIPAIVSSYSILLCAAALLSNPKTACNSFSTSSISELVELRSTEKAAVNWFLLLTAVTCMIYAAMTGSPSLVVCYKCFRSCILRRRHFPRSESSCPVSELCWATLSNDSNLESGVGKTIKYLNPLDRREMYPNDREPTATDRTQADEETNCMATQRTLDSQGEVLFRGDPRGISVRSTTANINGGVLVGASSSGSGGESTGENTALLRDHHRLLMSSDSELSPCSSKSADELSNNSALLFHIQLGLSSCYLAVQLSDWTATENALSGKQRNEYLDLEAMHLKLIGDYFVWILYGFVLLNSYLIYIRHNRRLRVLIGA